MENEMSKHTFRILNNGREVENIHADEYPTMEEAFCAGVNAVDDLCPRMSPNRRFYSVETTQIEDNKIDRNLIAAAPDLLAACKAAERIEQLRDEIGSCHARINAQRTETAESVTLAKRNLEAYRAELRTIRQSLRAAIAKAEGGAA